MFAPLQYLISVPCLISYSFILIYTCILIDIFDSLIVMFFRGKECLLRDSTLDTKGMYYILNYYSLFYTLLYSPNIMHLYLNHST
jgi:hypothetical protein